MYQLFLEKKHFDLAKTLESGQVFRYYVLKEMEFVIVSGQSYVKVKQLQDKYQFDCSKEEYLTIWKSYLDLDRDYEKIQADICRVDQRLATIIEKNQGIRILRQDPFEMLISFIISQSKSIVQIRKLVEELAVNFGTYLGKVDQMPIYAFPTENQLAHLTSQDFRLMKFGYRADYLVDAVWKVHQKEIDLKDLTMQNDEIVFEELKKVKGVGNKVAACVMLFSYGCYRAFPIDTWMRKIMLQLYYEDVDRKKVKDIELEEKGKQLFGSWAGFAQQYLFEYARDIKTL